MLTKGQLISRKLRLDLEVSMCGGQTLKDEYNSLNGKLNDAIRSHYGTSWLEVLDSNVIDPDVEAAYIPMEELRKRGT